MSKLTVTLPDDLHQQIRLELLIRTYTIIKDIICQ